MSYLKDLVSKEGWLFGTSIIVGSTFFVKKKNHISKGDPDDPSGFFDVEVHGITSGTHHTLLLLD